MPNEPQYSVWYYDGEWHSNSDTDCNDLDMARSLAEGYEYAYVVDNLTSEIVYRNGPMVLSHQ